MSQDCCNRLYLFDIYYCSTSCHKIAVPGCIYLIYTIALHHVTRLLYQAVFILLLYIMSWDCCTRLFLFDIYYCSTSCHKIAVPGCIYLIYTIALHHVIRLLYQAVFIWYILLLYIMSWDCCTRLYLFDIYYCSTSCHKIAVSGCIYLIYTIALHHVTRLLYQAVFIWYILLLYIM